GAFAMLETCPNGRRELADGRPDARAHEPVGRGHPLPRLRCSAKLDDAQACARNALRMLSGQRVEIALDRLAPPRERQRFARHVVGLGFVAPLPIEDGATGALLSCSVDSTDEVLEASSGWKRWHEQVSAGIVALDSHVEGLAERPKVAAGAPGKE